MNGKVKRCTTCGRRERRSTQANARYWLLLHTASQKLRPGGQQFSPETLHHYYKSRFLGCDDFALPNGEVLVIPKSSADLPTDDFAVYCEQVEADLAERGVFLDSLETA